MANTMPNTNNGSTGSETDVAVEDDSSAVFTLEGLSHDDMGYLLHALNQLRVKHPSEVNHVRVDDLRSKITAVWFHA